MRNQQADSRPVVLIGAGGHAKVVADACREAGAAIAGYLDVKSVEKGLMGELTHLGGDDRIDDGAFVAAHRFVLGMGDQSLRRKLAGWLAEAEAACAVICHPSATVSQTVDLAPGTVVLAGANVGPDSRIGAHAIINTHASVDHDGQLQEGVQVSPGATLAGGVSCGAYATIGPGATVVAGVAVGAWAVIGAGAVLLSQARENGIYFGVPARQKPA